MHVVTSFGGACEANGKLSGMLNIPRRKPVIIEKVRRL